MLCGLPLGLRHGVATDVLLKLIMDSQQIPQDPSPDEAVVARSVQMQAADHSLLDKLLSNISDTVSVVDEAGSLRYVSGQGHQSLGYSTLEWSRMQVFDLVHPEDRPRALEMAGKVLSAPSAAFADEFRMRSSSGNFEDLEVSAINMLADPDVRGVVVTSRNVTERNRAAAELELARDRAVEAADARLRFVATVSHELRSPLHAIVGIEEMLTLRLSDAVALGLVERISQQTDLIVRLIDGLLDLSRAQGGAIEPSFDAFDPRELAQEVVQLCLRSHPERTPDGSQHLAPTVEVKVACSSAVPQRVLLDRFYLRQVLTNLVGNALKFTSHGEVTIGIDLEADRLIFTVSDTGTGIEQRDLPHVFEPFRQVGSTSRDGGFGLGLSICKQLVDVMGGTLSAESQLGAGSQFRCNLPFVADRRSAVRESESVVDQAEVLAAGRAEIPTVLIADDSAVNRLLLKEQLAYLGCHCIEASGGTAALERLDGSVDLIVMDWRMPGMDGLEATRRIRARGWTGPIVGLTASVMESEKVDCLAAGMDEVVSKPARLGAIAELVDRWLGSTNMASTDRPDTAAAQDSLAAELGEAAALQLIQVFLEELPMRMNKLCEALGTDPTVVQREAHALRSTLELMGAESLAETCHRLEESPRLGIVTVEALRAQSAAVVVNLKERESALSLAITGGSL